MPLISSWKFQHKVTYFFNSRPLLPLGWLTLYHFSK
jgi:hypothetical protein